MDTRINWIAQLHIKVYGNVQGVNFRYWARDKAYMLNLTGFAKNESDGSVAISVEGDKEALETFLKMCYDGPSMAKVTRVKAKWKETIRRFEKFDII